MPDNIFAQAIFTALLWVIVYYGVISPASGGEDFTWYVHVFANDSAPGHNLMGLHDVHVTALLACDDCSEDVTKLDADEIAACLDYLTRIGEGP